jgi:hypothetical protein
MDPAFEHPAKEDYMSLAHVDAIPIDRREGELQAGKRMLVS